MSTAGTQTLIIKLALDLLYAVPTAHKLDVSLNVPKLLVGA